MAVELRVGDSGDLDGIAGLWEQLNRHHGDLGGAFGGRFRSRVFAQRREELQAKARLGASRLLLAWDGEADRAVGYCFSTAVPGGAGEVESLYLEPAHRSDGLGSAMVGDALAWMGRLGVERKVLVVVSGNDRALDFYARLGFRPRRVEMEWVAHEGA